MIHCRREYTAIKTGRLAAALHTLDHVLVLFEYGLPPFAVSGSGSVEHGPSHALVVIEYLEPFMGPAQTVRLDQDGVEVVAVHAEQNVRVKGDVFRPRFPE